MTFKPPAYPKELTDKWWHKNKGVIANIATKFDGTGLGKQLSALQKAYQAIDWKHIDFEMDAPGNLGSRKPEDIKLGIERARAAAKAIQPVYQMFRDVENNARLLVGQWGKSKTIPKSAIATAKKVQDVAQDFSFHLSLGTLAEIAKDGVAKEAAAKKKHDEIIKKALADMPAKLDQLAKDCDKGVTVADWGVKFWPQNVRFLGTQLPKLQKLAPDLKPEIAAVQVHSNKCNTPKDQAQLNTWTKDLAKAARALNAKLPNLN